MKTLFLLLFVALIPNTLVPSTAPKEVYGAPDAAIALRIGNGAAGATGILGALAEDFIAMEGAHHAIAWHQNISRLNLQGLREHSLDMALTYERDQEDALLQRGEASHRTLIFNDHFIIVGPKQNPAGVLPGDAPHVAFDKIARLGEFTGAPLFLSRNDGSATHVKEQVIWAQAGRDPSHAVPAWYVRHTVFPADALAEAHEQGLYTLIDQGTWLNVRGTLPNAVVFVQGGELLRNPCYALLQTQPTPLAEKFLAYLASDRAQSLIAFFGKDRNGGAAFFTRANQPDF